MNTDYELTSEQVESFSEDGYLIVRDLFDIEEVEMLLKSANSDRFM